MFVWLDKANTAFWEWVRSPGGAAKGLLPLVLAFAPQVVIETASYLQSKPLLIAGGVLLVVLSLSMVRVVLRTPFATVGEWTCGYTLQCPHCNGMQELDRLGTNGLAVAFGQVPPGRFYCEHCDEPFRT